jgi:membrane-bound serine protease (ClpP class)
MKQKRFWLQWLLLIGVLVSLGGPGAAGAQAPHVDLITIRGDIITPVYDYIKRGIQVAEGDGAQALIIELDTPGGLILTTQQIIEAMNQSKVPLIVYITPRGAMAASAGTLITLAGHMAAMAPETAIGAASPVGPQGEDLPETAATKTKEILKALVRTQAARRGDAVVQLAEAMIEESRAVSEKEAIQIGLIDCVAVDVDDLLRQMDGREVTVQGQTIKLATSGAPVKRISSNLMEDLLRTILNPNISFLLLTIGVQAILIELSSPGGWVAGFVGVVCLALFVYSVGIIPVNWLGLGLIAIAVVLFVLDVQAPTHGALTLAGLGTFVAGALILFNAVPGAEQELSMRLSVPLVVGTGVVMALTSAFFIGKVVQAQRRPAAMGAESLVGRSGRVVTELNPRGTVHVAGEVWTAETAGASLPAGCKVHVTRVDGLTLWVKPYDE